ncbi:alcohol acetyltransferase [Xylariales sp. PMI_506]|nr:alcohol acetyltransferase [Xylariales sp. PMI_506]
MSCFRNSDAAAAKPAILRPLGPMERFQSGLQAVKHYAACIVTCRYNVPAASSTKVMTQAALQDVFEQALTLAVLEHPMLHVGIADADGKKPQWVRIDQIDLRQHVEWLHVSGGVEDFDKALIEAQETQHDTFFAPETLRPQWRVTVLQPEGGRVMPAFIEVIFAYNHTIADGMSGKIFHETLLEKLDEVTLGEARVDLKNRTFNIPPPASFPPPLEDMLKYLLTARFLALVTWQEVIRPPFLTPKVNHQALWSPIAETPYKTRLALISVPRDTLKAVLAACRKHKTTLTGLLQTLGLLSLSARVPEDQAKAFTCNTPFSLRPFLRADCPVATIAKYPDLKPERLIGNNVSMWNYVFNEDEVRLVRAQLLAAGAEKDSADLERTLWRLAFEFRQGLAKRLELPTTNDAAGLCNLVGDFRTYHRDQTKKPRVCSWEVSNLGVIEPSSRAAAEAEKSEKGSRCWSIERAAFTQSVAVCAAPVLINPIAVKGKDLVITLTWQAEVVPDEFAQGVAADLDTWLRRIAQNSDTGAYKGSP